MHTRRHTSRAAARCSPQLPRPLVKQPRLVVQLPPCATLLHFKGARRVRCGGRFVVASRGGSEPKNPRASPPAPSEAPAAIWPLFLLCWLGGRRVAPQARGGSLHPRMGAEAPLSGACVYTRKKPPPRPPRQLKIKAAPSKAARA